MLYRASDTSCDFDRIVHKNDATRVTVGASTGLGRSKMVGDGATPRVVKRHGHVSYERLF